MTSYIIKLNGVLRVLLLLLILSPLTLLASIGHITASSGDVSIYKGNGVKEEAKGGVKLDEKDKIVTGADGKAQLKFSDSTVITLGVNSDFAIEEYINDDTKPKASFSIGKGTFKALTGAMGKINPEGFKLKTKTATIGIRGTGILGQVTPQENKIACTQGAISVTSVDTGVSVDVGAGQITSVAPNTPPAPPRAYSPQEVNDIESSSGVGEMPDDTETQNNPEAETTEGDVADEEEAANEDATTDETDATAENDDTGAEGEATAEGDATTPEALPEATDIEATDSIATSGVTETDQTENFLDLTANQLGESVDVLINRVNDGDYEVSGDLSEIGEDIVANPDVFDVDNIDRDVKYDGIIGFAQFPTSPGDGFYGYANTLDGFHLLGYSLTGGGSIDSVYSSSSPSTPFAPSQPINISVDFTMPTLNSSSHYVGWAKVYDSAGTQIFSDSKQEFIFWQNWSVVEQGGSTYDMQKYALIGDGTPASSFDTMNTDGIVEYQTVDSSGKIMVNMRNNNLLWFEMKPDKTRLLLGSRADDTVDGVSLAGFSASGFDMSKDMGNPGVGDTTLNASVFGSEYQGLGMSVGTNDSGGSSFMAQGSAAYKGYDQTTSTPTGTLAYSGFFSGFDLDTGSGTFTPLNTASSGFNISITRDSGNIAGTFFGNSLSFSGGSDSAYINDDYFAAVGIKSGSAQSYMVAVDDTPNSGSDWVTWGYWATADTLTAPDGYMLNSHWIAGQVASDIATQINALQTDGAVYTYTSNFVKGSVVDTGNIYNIDSGSVALDIHFGSAEPVNFSISLSYNSGTNWSATVDRTVNGHNGTLAAANGIYSGDFNGLETSGQVRGQLYGPNLEQTGGMFNMSKNSGAQIATGIFKANR